MARNWNRAGSLIVLIMVIRQLLLLTTSSSQTVSHDCQAKCADVDIPYPFGIGDGCYLNDNLRINCTTEYNDSPSDLVSKPYLWDSNFRVLNISTNGELRVNTYIGSSCYDGNSFTGIEMGYSHLPGFFFSSTQNKFIVIGCNAAALFESIDQDNTRGCLSLCGSIDEVVDGVCSGIGCCEAEVPEKLSSFDIVLGNFSRNHSDLRSFNPRTYAFLVAKDAFNFSKGHLNGAGMISSGKVPTVVEWAVWNETCDEAKKNLTRYACKVNSECFDGGRVPGYRCNCSSGYEGNPYLGCTDIDECKDVKKNNCTKDTCKNTQGKYECSCPKGSHGDARVDGIGCIADPSIADSLVFRILVGVGVGFIVLLLSSCIVHMGYKKRKLRRLKRRFKENGGLLLQQRLHERDKSAHTVKIFTAEELDKATDSFDESRIVGRGGYGTVYKGFLLDDTVIAIKKSQLTEKSQIEQFINEVVVLSQINHRNVVKLLGCCLETEVPLLVYEFVSNGTLYDHLHNSNKSKMTWETRLRIATETAGVLSYLHSAASIPIIHRDVKSTNILLDNNCTSKVSDFGASRLVPLDQMQLTTMVQGTLGYLDPEYLQTSQLTEKSDVYSFGVVLIELMTGKKALSFDRLEEERSLAMHFLSALKEDRLFEILEEFIVNEENSKQVKEVANLARCCVRVKGEERPSMKEVALELEGLRAMANHPWVNISLDPEEVVHLLGDTSNSGVYSNTAVEGFTGNSMKKQVMPTISNGR